MRFSIPPSTAPYVVWATEHITLLGLVGMGLLSWLLALKSWRAAQPRDSPSRMATATAALLALHVVGMVLIAPYRALVVDVGRRLGVRSGVAHRPEALLLGGATIAIGIVLLVWAANRLRVGLLRYRGTG